MNHQKEPNLVCKCHENVKTNFVLNVTNKINGPKSLGVNDG